MENPTLAEGSSFGDVVSQTPLEPDATNATPVEEVTETTPAATEGGETPAEPEIPAAFKEATSEDEDEGKPDLSLDSDLEGHPILKAKWESYKAQKERGIDKFIAEEKAKTAQIEAQLKEYEPLVQGFENFKAGPEPAWQELADLEDALVRAYGPRPGTATSQTGTQEPADGESKYGLEFPSDDKVVDVVLTALEKKLDERLGKLDPLIKAHETAEQTKVLESKAESVLPALKRFETAADRWITKDMVIEAVREFPQIDGDAAFRAKYAVEIGKFYERCAAKGQQVRDLPTGTLGGRTQADLKPGASFADILQSEAVLG